MTITFGGEEFLLEDVPYTVEEEQDPGCWTHRNGDPGEPGLLTADVTLDWDQADAVEALEASCDQEGRAVPEGTYRAPGAVLGIIRAELERLLWDGRVGCD